MDFNFDFVHFPLIPLCFFFFCSLQILLERYFAMSGEDIEIVLPKQINLQEKLRKGTPLDIDFSPKEFVD